MEHSQKLMLVRQLNYRSSLDAAFQTKRMSNLKRQKKCHYVNILLFVNFSLIFVVQP